MFRLIRVIFVVLLIFIATLAGLTQMAQAGGVVGNGTPGSCTEASLNTALAGGGSVTFNCGGSKTILVLNVKTITQTTTIDGGGQITLTGGLATRLFNVSNGVTLTLRNIILDSFFAVGSDGGAISNNGTLYLENSTIQFSQTDNNHSGGAIFSAGPVFISNSTLRKNTAGSAGAIFINFGNARAQISNSRLIQNQAVNTTTGYGGAIWVGTQANLNVVDSEFIINSAQFGGALYVTQGGTATLSSQAEAFRTKLSSNFVTYGNTTCGGGGTCSAGGAIYSEGDLNVSDVEFLTNKTPETTAGVGYGGAIASNGTLRLYHNILHFNKARFGGALYVGALPGAPRDSARATMDASTFRVNSADRLGGGLYTGVYTAVVTATHTIFQQNSALDSGGGIARFEADLRLFDSSFTDNQATNAGGGLYAATRPGVDPAQVFILSVTFSGNKTTGGNHGGAIANGYGGSFIPNGGRMYLGNVTLISNTNGIYNSGTNEQTTLHASVLMNPGTLNCDGDGTAVTTNGRNFSTDNSCLLSFPSDTVNGLDARLGPRQLDGTFFHLPLSGSPLINRGADCPPLDQRGAIRPDTCDIGAVEFGGLLPRLYLPLLVR